MRAKNTQSLLGQALLGATFALGSMLALSAHAAAPGITGGTSGAHGLQSERRCHAHHAA